jgi:hypothetical protein
MARKTSTEAVTWAGSPPKATRPPISTASTTPAPPGVKRIAVSRRAPANTNSTWAQPTSASPTPTWRRVTSRTRYSDRWLTSAAAVMAGQRRASSSLARERNFAVASAQP